MSEQRPHTPGDVEQIFGGDVLPQMAGDADPERLAVVTKRLRAAASGQELSARRAALKELADATRSVIDRIVGTDAPDETLLAAAAEVRAAAARFEGFHQGVQFGFAESANAGDRENPMFDHSPLIGIANPLAPPMTIDEADGQVVANVTFGHAYEGPPGCVHGGYVAAAFDEVLGATQSLTGAPGMTGTLSVRYESPTPLLEPLRIVGKVVGVERRKIFTQATCYAGDRVTATATGIFISLRPGQFLELLDEREARQEEHR